MKTECVTTEPKPTRLEILAAPNPANIARECPKCKGRIYWHYITAQWVHTRVGA